MKPKIVFSLFLFFLLLLSVSASAWAVGTITKSEQSSFTLKVTDNFINLKAEQASIKDILRDLEKKTEIKIKLFPGADDKRVTLSISDLPVYAVHTFLEKMGVENFAVVYDHQLASKVVYVLSAGKDINKIIKNNKNLDLLPEQIDVNVAQLVAEDYLPKYYPGDWIYFHHLVFYDLNGQPAAYAFIYRKPSSKLETMTELEQIVFSASQEIGLITKKLSQIKEANDISEQEKKNKSQLLKRQLRTQKNFTYQLGSFATVITGANETSSLIYDHYKGLPPSFAKKYDLKKELVSSYPQDNLELRRVLFLSPFDIRYEVVGPDKFYAINLKTKRLEDIALLKEKIQQTKSRKSRKRDLMRPKERELYDQGSQARDKENIQRWHKYKEQIEYN